MDRNEAEDVNDPFSNLENGCIVPLRMGGKVGHEIVERRCGDMQRAELISSWFLRCPLECLDHVCKVGLITVMIPISDEENRTTATIARRNSSTLDRWENRKACPYIGVAIHDTIVRCEMSASRQSTTAALLPEHELGNLSSDVERDRTASVSRQVQLQEVDSTSADQ